MDAFQNDADLRLRVLGARISLAVAELALASRRAVRSFEQFGAALELADQADRIAAASLVTVDDWHDPGRIVLHMEPPS